MHQACLYENNAPFVTDDVALALPSTSNVSMREGAKILIDQKFTFIFCLIKTDPPIFKVTLLFNSNCLLALIFSQKNQTLSRLMLLIGLVDFT